MQKKPSKRHIEIVKNAFYVESQLPYIDRLGMLSVHSKRYYVYAWNKDRTERVKIWVDEEQEGKSNTE